MKTTEIFVEQVLIGLLVLAIGGLPYWKWCEVCKAWDDLGKGVLLIAVAYLLGIIFDRYADTLLSRVEQYHSRYL